ncbi:titin homolog [Mercenaria mercenaria]|uniref:titin homolog n=1 Tax=Mercenaria mercenaria TaxID=6596 RepID=UPI00234F921B|nr:titin homolog [Mercenaria mercenaria]
MSKEELNNEISDSQTENTPADSDLNTQQNVEPNLIQESSDTNQLPNKTDHKINSDSLDESRDSNLISEDLKNVNKHDDSGSVNEKSTLDIEKSADSNNIDDKSQSQCLTEVSSRNESDSTNLAENAVLAAESNKSGGENIESSRESLPKSVLHSEADIKESQDNKDSKSVTSGAVADDKTDVEGEIGKADNKSTGLCTDSGPHFSKPDSSDILKDKEEKEKDTGDEPEVNETLENNADEKQNITETNLPEDLVKEREADTEALSRASDENKGDTQVDKTDTEAYEDDFEELTEDDKNKVNTDLDHTDVDNQENESKCKGESSENIKTSINDTGNLDDTETNSKEHERTSNAGESSENLNINENGSKETTEDQKNATVETNVGENKTSDDSDINIKTKTDKESVDSNSSKSVNKEREEKELTEIVIDEDGIPKVAITTVPDRPPSSQAGDSEDKSDPFEDFDFDTAGQDRNKPESKESEEASRAKEEQKSEKQEEEDRMSDKVEMENAGKDDTGDSVINEKDNESGKGDVSEAQTGEQDAIETEEPGTKDESNKENEQIADTKVDKTESQSDEPAPQNKDGGTVTEKVTENDNSKNSTPIPKAEERSKSPEPVPVPKQESPLEQMLKRNVKIDGTVDSVTELETNVTTLLNSMKDVMKYYSDLLKLQALKDFTNDLGKFRGDFTSINEAFKRCNSMSMNVNQHLKELRHVTEDVRAQIHRKFQQEDLSTWVDISPEKEKEKERLQEESVAAERASMAKAAEARHAVAIATSGVAEANQLIAEMETQAAEAQAISLKAEAQARTALIAAEEAKVAAEERRRAEEAAKKRAEERARIKAAEEEKKKALEEMKIHQEAAAKGTSVEDERKTFMEEKKRKEEERKNPKNWPRLSYKTEGVDFNPAVGCIIRAIEGSMRNTDVKCSYVDQSEGILTLGNTEELVSNIIQVKQTEEDRAFTFEEPLSVALPVCISRIPTGKETVVKQMMSNGAWRELPTADVQFEDYRELKFVEGRCSKFGTFVVVLRPKKDTLQFQKKGCKLLCSSDSRISFSSRPGTFKQNINAILEVQTLDSNAVHDLKTRFSKECEDLLTASPFIKFSMPVRTFEKPLTLTLPLPQTQTRQKRPATGITRETRPTQDLRPSTARPSTTTEEDATEEIFFLHRDDKSGWTVNSKMHLVQPKSKDTVTFDITLPYERMLLLRTKAGKRETAVEKMATLLENITTQRNVKVIVRQRNDDVADVMVACTSSNRAERTLKYMEDNAFTEGPNPSPDIVIKEGQQLYMKFRGNMECISENPSLSFIYNTNIRATREFKINEREEFAQKSLPCYRGFVQIFTKALVPKPIPEGAPKNVQPEMVEAEVLLTELLVELPKPEAEPPKPLATAPLQLKEGPLTNGVLRYIAGMLGKEWKEVAAHLGLKPMRIQAILRNHVNKDTAETRFDMLVTWAKRVPKAVDKVQILCNALTACGRGDVAEEVRHKGQQYKQQRFMSARVSHLRQAFVKVAKTTAVFNHWKNFAKNLGVSEDEIKRIDESGGSGQEKCYNSLETWKDVAGEEATVTSLATYLKTAKQERLSRDLETMVAS